MTIKPNWCFASIRLALARISRIVDVAESSIQRGWPFSSLTVFAISCMSFLEAIRSRIFLISARARQQIKRIASCEAVISRLKTRTPFAERPPCGRIACSAKFIAKLVFPTEGRAAKTIIWPGWKPYVIPSRSRKPDMTPSASFLPFNIAFMSATACSSGSSIGVATLIIRPLLILCISSSIRSMNTEISSCCS